MRRAMKLAPFGVLVFVVWKLVVRTLFGKLWHTYKGRPVLDIRTVNGWAIKDAYPLTT